MDQKVESLFAELVRRLAEEKTANRELYDQYLAETAAREELDRQWAENQVEIPEKAQKLFEKYLDKASINCEDEEGVFITPTIEILEENYQGLKETVGDIVNQFNKHTEDLKSMSEPYRAKLNELDSLKVAHKDLLAQIHATEERIRMAPIRLTRPNPDAVLIALQHNGEYVYGLRIPPGSRQEMWKAIKDKIPSKFLIN